MAWACCLTPKFSCKHTTTIAAKPHPKSACLLQRSLGGGALPPADHGKTIDTHLQPAVWYLAIACLVPDREAVHRIHVQTLNNTSRGSRVLLNLRE